MKLETLLKLTRNKLGIKDFTPIERYSYETNGYETFFEVPYTGAGDYAGAGSVGLANAEYIKDNFKSLFDSKALYELKLDYGYKCIAIPKVLPKLNKSQIESLIDLLDRVKDLCNYPLFDDEYLAEIESELENEAWNSVYKRDFLDCLIKKYPEKEDRIYDIDDNSLFELFESARDRANVYWINEYTSMYIDVDRVVNEVNL